MLRKAATLAVALCSAAAYAQVLNFDSLSHGQIVSDVNGVGVSAINPNRAHDLAIIFDTLEVGTADPDLQGPQWAAGNLAPDTVLGNVLIIAENDVDTSPADGLIDSPDDEGNRPAGRLIFEYATPITQFGFDLVDVEGVTDEAGSVTFFLDEAQVGQVLFADFLDGNSPFYDPTVQFGNNSANRIAPITTGTLNSGGFDRVEIALGGSGAVDNIVPEPASLGLLMVGLLLAVVRR